MLKHNAYSGILSMRFIRGLSYRSAALAGMATQFFFGLVFIMIFQAFAAQGNSPMDASQIASYVWLQQAFLALLMLWYRDGELLGTITSGDTAYELCRPVDLYWFWAFRLWAGRLAAAALRCLPILVIAFLLPEPWRLHLPASPLAALGFGAALLLGSALVVTVSMAAYIITMQTLSPQVAFIILVPFMDFASGNVVPIPLMPDWLGRVLEFLPFRYCQDMPLRIWSGSFPLDHVPRLLGLQVLWIAGLSLLGRLWMHRVLAKAAIPGA